MQRKTIAISLLGTVLDFAGKRWDRWHKWRPNIGLCSQEDLPIHQLYLLHDNHSARLAETVKADISEVSDDTEVNLQTMHFDDPWDFEEVYAKLYDWCKAFSFDTDTYDYLFHITTGSHVVQVCGFMLTESNYFPGRVIQTSPDKNKDKEYIGRAHIIDTDLSKYEKLASRFEQEKLQSIDILKAGILTQNDDLNNLIDELEKQTCLACGVAMFNHLADRAGVLGQSIGRRDKAAALLQQRQPGWLCRLVCPETLAAS